MKKYYAERHGLITKQLQIDFEELLEYFRQIYKYFCDKDYFKVAIDGVWKQMSYGQDPEQIIAPSMAPSAEVYFATRLQSKEIWYDWMMQYYTSVIITFYKLKNKHTEIDF